LFLVFLAGAVIIASAIFNSQSVPRIFEGSVGGAVAKSNSQSVSRAIAGACQLPLPWFVSVFSGAVIIASAISDSQSITRIFEGAVGGAVTKSNSQSVSRAFAGAMLIAIVIICF